MQIPTLSSMSMHWLYMSLIFSVVKAIDWFSMGMNNYQRWTEMHFRM